MDLTEGHLIVLSHQRRSQIPFALKKQSKCLMHRRSQGETLACPAKRSPLESDVKDFGEMLLGRLDKADTDMAP